MKRKLSPSAPTCTERWGDYFFCAPLHRICTTGRLKFLCDPGRLSCKFYQEQQHTTPYHTGRRGEGQKFPLACFVAARLVNPQECRRRRDPFSTDRSSTKPCGRSRSGTRAYLPSGPVLTDLYGKQLLQSTQHDCTTAERVSTTHRGPSQLPPHGLLSSPVKGACGRKEEYQLCRFFTRSDFGCYELMAHRARFGVARISSAGGDYVCFCANFLFCCVTCPVNTCV